MGDTATTTNFVEIDGDAFEWAVVEIFGHRRHCGRAREEERFGSKMLRIDVPKVCRSDEGALRIDGWSTHYYGGSAIFSYSLTDEASVLRANAPYSPPARIAYGGDERDCSDDDREESNAVGEHRDGLD